MNSKNNRVNHNFQILHFLVGSCHTADGAYALLCDLLEERTNALNQVAASDFRKEAKLLRARRVIDDANADEAEVLLARADVAEIEGWKECNDRNLVAARDEVAFIKECMEKLQRHRKFGNLSLPEAHEAAQREEWRLELVRRAENFLLTQGSIPADEFNTMRSHPDFNQLIWPQVKQIANDIKDEKFIPASTTVAALLPKPTEE